MTVSNSIIGVTILAMPFCFKQGYSPYEGTTNFIPETKFKCLTFVIVAVSLIIGILIPNIEVVLGLVGSTIGTLICVIFPLTCFICISTKNTNERLLAQVMLFVGVLIMVMGTYANLYAMEEINTPLITEKALLPSKTAHYVEKIFKSVETNNNLETIDKVMKKTDAKIENAVPDVNMINDNIRIEEIRHEPPQPEEPRDAVLVKTVTPPLDIKKIELIEDNKEPAIQMNKKVKLSDDVELRNDILKEKKPDEVDKAAIEKEEKELLEAEKEKHKNEDKIKEELLEALKKHKEEQQILIKEQKEILEEIKKEKKELKNKQLQEINDESEARRKAANQIVEIAKKAIESLGTNTKDNLNNNSPQINGESQEITQKEVSNVPLNINESHEVSKKKIIPLPLILNYTFSYKSPNVSVISLVNLFQPKPDSLLNKDNNSVISVGNNVEKVNHINELVVQENKKQNVIKEQLIQIKVNSKEKNYNRPKSSVGENILTHTEQEEDKGEIGTQISNQIAESKMKAIGRDILSEMSELPSLRKKRDVEHEKNKNDRNQNCQSDEKIKINEKRDINSVPELPEMKLNVNLGDNPIDNLKLELKSYSFNLKRK